MKEAREITSRECPLTGMPGQLVRIRKPGELAESYRAYCGSSLPKEVVEQYFTSEIAEYFSQASGLRWYVPATLGDGNYYQTLAEIYSWYYNPGSWDKVKTAEILQRESAKSVIEIGCGSGWLLEELRARNITSSGVEINPSEVAKAKQKGLTVTFPDEPRRGSAEWLCLLQTIEHVANPAQFLQEQIIKYGPTSLILSAPCFESLLGRTSDPLSWPPHHATAWSLRAFQTLGKLLDFHVTEAYYSPLPFGEFESRVRLEPERKLFRLPRVPRGLLGRLYFEIARKFGKSWARRGHSILVVMQRDSH